MEDIIDGDKFNIISKRFPESLKQGERYSIKLTVEHLRLYPDKCLVKLYDSAYPAKLITSKTLDFIGWEEKDFDFSLMMGSKDQYYRIVVIDDNPITSDTVQDGFNAMVRYEAPVGEFCIQEFHTSLDNVSVRASITVSGQDIYTNEEGFGSITLIKDENLTAVARTGVLTLTKDFTSCTSNILSFSFDSNIPDIGDGIGSISHLIKEQEGNDEIKFSVKVSNNSSVEQCYILKLYDESGTFVAKEPKTIQPGLIPIDWKYANRILPGQTETMIIDSNMKFWHIGAVQGQIVRFDLIAMPIGWFDYCSMDESKYVLVDSKTYKVPEHKEDPYEILDKLIILVIVIIVAMLVAKFS